jgi:hypothetical protein
LSALTPGPDRQRQPRGRRHSGAAAAKATAAAKGQTLSSGIATQYIEPSVRAAGRFLRIPERQVAEDRRDPGRQGELGRLHELRENTLPQLRGIIEKVAAGTRPRAPTRSASATSTPASWTKRAWNSWASPR